MAKIYQYLNSKLITFLKVENRDQAIRELVLLLKNSNCLKEKQGIFSDDVSFLNAIIEREKIVTTGIGMGVAIPHAKLPNYDHFFMAIGILEKGVDWGALDGATVRLVFLIGGPDDRQTEYLQILSSLTMALKDEDRRKKMLISKSPEEILKLFEGC